MIYLFDIFLFFFIEGSFEIECIFYFKLYLDVFVVKFVFLEMININDKLKFLDYYIV